MKIQEVYEFYNKKWSHAGRAFGVNDSTIRYWRDCGYIPFRSQILIEKITDGKLKADEKDGRPPEAKNVIKKIKEKHK